MQFEIIDETASFKLYGLSSEVNDKCFGDVGSRLMNDVWKIVNETGLKTTGFIHWVYPKDTTMFVGLKLPDVSTPPIELELVEFELQRYIKHVHVGPYSELPKKWKMLKSEFAGRGESGGSHGVEIYGEPSEDESKLETTILIGLSAG